MKHSIWNFNAGLSLNHDGTVFVVQYPNDYSNFQLVYRRNSASEQFALEEILSP